MISWYRKYRPQKTVELDLANVREFFGNMLSSGKFTHAYLFSGPKGIGKTSAARILAKLVNCEKNDKAVKTGRGKLVEPCGRCRMCKRIASGSSLAVVEMDAASNRGIDDIRLLRERIGLTPAEGSRIVYIIDEVHMLTTEAFNALLKTLEEPPPHAVFVLCTTEPHKLPETVVSRCTRLTFAKATREEVVRSLKKVIKGEGLTVDAGGLELLAESVDGSFRDGMKILEQLTQGGKKISQKAIKAIVGKSGEYETGLFIKALDSSDVKAALGEIRRLDKAGANFNIFVKRVLEDLRSELLAKMEEGRKGDEVTQLIRQIDVLSESMVAMKSAFIPQLPLEMAVAEYCFESEVEVENREDGVDNEAVEGEKPEARKVSVSKSRSTGKGIKLEEIEQRWREVLSGVKPHNHSLEALLRASRPFACDGNRVTLEVFYAFHKEQLEQERHRRVLENVISQLFSANVRLEFVLGQKKKIETDDYKKSDVGNVSGNVDDEELASAAEEIFGA